MKKYNKLLILTIFILIEEIIFSISTINKIDNIMVVIIFTTIIAIFIDLITNLFKKRLNKIIYYITLGTISILFIVYFVYYKLMGNVLSIYSLVKGVEQATPFTGVLLKIIQENWILILGFITILAIVIIFSIKFINFEKKNKKQTFIELLSLVLIYLVSIMTIVISSSYNEIYSNKNIYFNINNPKESIKKFGLLTTFRLDIQRTFTNFKEKDMYLYKNKNGEEKVIEKDKYNISNINLDKIANNTNNKEVKEICNYLSSIEPTNKNEYTGRYKGKNLIVFVAESFSNMAIREDVTPTLYKLKNEGINFNNFYTPLFPVSTADGEYLTDTSLLPAEGIWSIENVEGKTFPYTYANILKNDGYSTFAYHNYDYKYYKRDKYFPTMGYDTYFAAGNGLENRMDFSKVPSSDYEMVKTTIDDYIEKEKFVAYYMTMSGHMNYDKSNAIVEKNWNIVKDLPYSNKAKAYLATQIELDKALQELVTRLEEKGKLDDTVIIIVGDHYPYGLTLEEMQELSVKQLDEFEKFNMPFIIYNSEEDKKIISNKYSSSLDVLPTILNLFGVEFDSRLLMGKDIFSDSEPLVIFSDRSYITNKGRYNSITEIFEGEDVDEAYINNVKQEIYYKYRYSRLILENDFYRYLANF